MADIIDSTIGPQPNFLAMAQSQEVMAKGQEAFAAEIRKMSNVPAFNSGQAILEALRRLDQKLDSSVQQLNRRLDQLDTKVNELGTKVDELGKRQVVSDHNHIARIQNSLLTDASHNLSLLVHPTTGSQIEGFPTKARDIERMTNPMLDTLLGELGLGTDGTKTAKQQRLRLHIGLPANPQP